MFIICLFSFVLCVFFFFFKQKTAYEMRISDWSSDVCLPICAALDALLSKKKKRDVEDVAYTIFPQRLWTMAQGDRAKLFEFYKMAFPFYRAQNPKANGKGLDRKSTRQNSSH